MSKKKKDKIFFGWWTVIFTGILSGLGIGVFDYGGSAFFKPLATELNFSRTAASAATGIGQMGTGIGGTLSGWLVDKFGPRWVIFVNLLIATAGLASMYFINSLWSYYVVWGIFIGTAMHMSILVPVDKTLANWFIRKRGLALGIKFTFISLIGVIVLPALTWQISVQGWRMTCLVWAGAWLLAAPFVLWFIKQQRPEYYGLLPDGARLTAGPGATMDSMIDRGIAYASSLEEVEFTFRQAIRTPAFWMLVSVMLFIQVVIGGFNLHCIPFLTDRGIDPTTAGAMMGMMVFFTAPARFFGGYITDRGRKNQLQFIMAGFLLLQIFGIGAFILYQSVAMIYVMLALFGLGSGVTGPMLLAIIGRYFGRKAFGSITGSIQLISAPVLLGSPVFAGWIYDTTGSYIDAFIVYTATISLAIIVLCFMRPPRAPEHITGIRQFM